MKPSLHLTPGHPGPLGSSRSPKGINFAIKSNTQTLTLALFDSPKNKTPLYEIPLDPNLHRTEEIWHLCIENPPQEYLYAIKTDSPAFLIDPYAKTLLTTHLWGSPSNRPYTPLCKIDEIPPFDWEGTSSPNHPLEDLIIYEMHVRGFTRHPSSQVERPGTFLGMIEKIPHLVELGINAVELLPVHEFNEQENHLINPVTLQALYNYWGYSTVNFFSPMQCYASSDEPDAPIREFKTLVRELHRHKIEVILDVVYNHTAEGNERGPTLCFKGLDNSTYYLLDTHGYQNFSGCGNTFNCNHPLSTDLIINSLRYWASEMQVDGFRFDLASIFYRGNEGRLLKNPPILEAINADPILSKVKLIAEAWDAGGLYQVGSFYPKGEWSEWNDKYRDHIRHFIKGTGSKNKFSSSLCGSQDVFPKYSPLRSINFITAHDGFNLHDLVSYNEKHNLENGEDNKDGANNNSSWNCGVEGPTTNAQIVELRERQMRNFHLALMISQGIPMLLMGDEYGHTKNGNNNTWCQDNELNWFLWDQLNNNREFFTFYQRLIAFRKKHPILRRREFLTPQDIEWHGQSLQKPQWDDPLNHLIAFTLKDHDKGEDLFVAFNANTSPSLIEFPSHPTKTWYWVANTASPFPYDMRDDASMTPIVNTSYQMLDHSAIILKTVIG